MDEDAETEAAGISLLVDGICRTAIRIYPAFNSYPSPRLGLSAWALLTFGLDGSLLGAVEGGCPV